MGIWEGTVCGGWSAEDLADARRRRDLERASGGRPARTARPSLPESRGFAERLGVQTSGYDPLAGASGLLRRDVKRTLGK